MVTRKPVPSRVALPQGWQPSNERPYAASSASNQATSLSSRRPRSPSSSPEMGDPWTDESVERTKTPYQTGTLPSGADGRQRPEEMSAQAESLPSSLRIGPFEVDQNTAEERQRFKSSRLKAQEIPPSTEIWQRISGEDDTSANIWRDKETSPVPPSGTPPPPSLAENTTGVLISIRASVNAEIIAVS